MYQEDSQQHGPASQLHLLSISFKCPAQRWYLPLGPSKGSVCLVMDLLDIKQGLPARLMMCQLLLQQILPEVSLMAS